MKIFTIYSPSHKIWYEILRTSLLSNCNNGYELSAKSVPQICKSGEYGSDDVTKFWYKKIKYIIELLDKETEPFLYSDCDVYFFRDFKDDLEKSLIGKDIVCQFEKKFFFFSMVCCGFMYMRPNDRVKRMFHWIYHNLEKYGDDQKALNRYKLKRKVSMGILPKTYYSINYDNGNIVWNGEDVKITIKNPFMVHIHWAIGLKTRLELLSKIRNHYKWIS